MTIILTSVIYIYIYKKNFSHYNWKDTDLCHYVKIEFKMKQHQATVTEGTVTEGTCLFVHEVVPKKTLKM